MNTVIPKCFENFKCTNKNCTDNCCIGWEIDVDEDSLRFYKEYNGKLSDKLSSSLSDTTPCHFIMDENSRCPFLNSENLCEIILEIGEDKIPYICKNHPRFYEWLYDRCEMGIGLACEEGARLLFESEEKFTVNFDFKLTDEISDILTYARETAFYILQLRSFSLRERFILFVDYSYALDELMFEEKYSEIIKLADTYKNLGFLREILNNIDSSKKEDITSFIGFFKNLEPIDDKWKDYIDALFKSSDKIFSEIESFLKFYEKRLYEYEQLASYYVYRYFLKAIYDNDVLSKCKLMIISVIFNIIMDTSSFINNKSSMRIYNSKLYSKEVEYSEENLDYILDEALENQMFSYESLISLINIL